MEYELIVAGTKEALRKLIELAVGADWILLSGITKASWSDDYFQAVTRLARPGETTRAWE